MNEGKQETESIYREALKSAEEPIQSGATPLGSLGHVKSDVDKKKELHEENKRLLGNIGWRKIDPINVPGQCKFNDATIRISIRACTMEEIKHYSSLDETDLIDVSEHVNAVLSACCKIEYADRVGTYEDLIEAAKYYLFFSIRDLTMESEQRQSKLWQRCQCPKCGKKSDNEITSHAFGVYTIPKNIMRHYDSTKRKLVIQHPEFGEPLVIGPPNIGITIAIQKYMQEHAKKQQQAGTSVYLDSDFMLKLQYLLDSPHQVNDVYLEQLKKKIGQWPAQKLIAFEYARGRVDAGINPQLEIICRDTKSIDGNEVGCKDDFSFSAPVTFQFGWRSVLDISGIIAELFHDPE